MEEAIQHEIIDIVNGLSNATIDALALVDVLEDDHHAVMTLVKVVKKGIAELQSIIDRVEDHSAVKFRSQMRKANRTEADGGRPIFAMKNSVKLSAELPAAAKPDEQGMNAEVTTYGA